MVGLAGEEFAGWPSVLATLSARETLSGGQAEEPSGDLLRESAA